MTPLKVFIGWDPREQRAWCVADLSLRSHASCALDIRRLAMPELVAKGLYTRPTGPGRVVNGPGSTVESAYWDDISDAPMSTGHAIARFLVPYLCGYEGLALFCDGDVLFREDVAMLFALADPQYAVQVVQHHYAPTETTKMDGQAQTIYRRKNWSSVVLFHCGHPANRALTLELVNTVPGRDLHRFCWLDDADIGPLPARWNLLVGHSAYDRDAALVHFTAGVPDMAGYEHQPYATEWRRVARAAGIRIPEPMPLQVPA